MPTDAALPPDLAERYARVALDNVRREFPYAPQHVVAGPNDLARPRALHPVFYGSFDWHSCVHMHWLLVRLLRLDGLPGVAGEVRGVLTEHLTADAVAAEAAYLRAHPSFERPYGWAWALRLAAECAAYDDADAGRWAAALQPLTDAVVDAFLGWLPRATYPVRHGVHGNSAFGVLLALDYADAYHSALAAALRDAARRWFAGDRGYPARFEPSGEDFLPPALVEAALMVRVLDPAAYAGWLAEFLPDLPGRLAQPVSVSDRSDYRIVHLDGLNLSRAWCWRAVGAALPAGDPRAAAAEAAATAHLDAALPHVATGGYGGDHWLASFAVLALAG